MPVAGYPIVRQNQKSTMPKRTIAGLLLLSIPMGAFASDRVLALEVHSAPYFSNVETVDRIEAATEGTRCEDAVLRIRISSRNDHTLYERRIPMNLLLPCSWQRKHPDKAPSSWALILNKAVSVDRAYDLRCPPKATTACWESPELERLRYGNAASLCHYTDSESTVCVAYDPETQNVIEIYRSTW